jgi:hypothetical protein
MKKIYPFLFCLLILSSVLTVQATTVNLTVTTDKTSYLRSENLAVSGSLRKDGQPVTNGLVAIQINSQNGDPMVIRTVNTGVNPTYPDPIANPDFLGQILNLYSSDFYQNPVNNVYAGALAQFTLTAQNLANEPRHLVTAVTVYDNNNVPVGVATSEIGTVPARSQSTKVVGVPIPASAVSGRATAFASIYSDMPKLGGKPFSLEASATFTINGVQGNLPPSSGNGNQGNYNLNFKLPPKCPVGTYTVYTTAAYYGVSDSKTTTFQVSQPGDLNGNGTVDFDDLLLFINAYVINHAPPYTVTPVADFDHNGMINFDDVLLFVNYYVVYRSIP